MSNSAELVVKIGNIHRQIEELSAKGFSTAESMRALYELESAVDALLSVATAEFRGAA
jgi:hypothetical protein